MLRCPNLHFSFCLISFWPPASGHLKCNPLALRCSLSSLLTLLLLEGSFVRRSFPHPLLCGFLTEATFSLR